MNIRIPHWSLYILRNLGFMRKIMPYYHREDKVFLRWYEGVVDGFASTNDSGYEQQLEVLRAVEAVNGYAEVRWPKMEAAMARGNQTLAMLRRTEITPSQQRR
jgi:indolepyruvate ferredoxin oxidoreductase